MCHFVSGMVDVNVHPQTHSLSPRIWYVSRYHIFHVAIELNPLVLLEFVIVYL